MDVVSFNLADSRRQQFDELFEACPSAFIQQSTWWAEVIQELGPDKPCFLLCLSGNKPVAGLPLYLFERPSGNILTSVPQAGPLGGVFCAENLAENEASQACAVLLGRALELARERACMALTLITNPFRPDVELYRKILEPDFLFENFTQHIPLTQKFRVSGGQKNNLARARRFGFSVECCGTMDEVRDWHALHRKRQAELGAEPPKFELFKSIFQVLVARKKATFLAARHNGRMASGCLYIHHRKVMDVYAIDMDSEFADHAPNAVNTEYSLNLAREMGVEIYNWQSSPNRQSGVYNAKKQWGSIEAPYFFVTKLLCSRQHIQDLGADGIKANYPGHYVVPFGVFEQGPDQVYFRKP